VSLGGPVETGPFRVGVLVEGVTGAERKADSYGMTKGVVVERV